MLIVELDGKKIKVPQSYSELTLDNFIHLWKILCKYNIDQPPTEVDDVDKFVEDEVNLTKEIVGKLLGISPKTVERIDYTQAQEVVTVFNNMLENDKFEKDWGGHSFEWKGETYYFPKTDFDKMSFGEYATLKQYEQVLSKDTNKRYDFIPEQIAWICRKKDEKKDSYNLKERTELFKDITMDVVMALTFFLHKRIETLQYLIQTYSKTEQTVQPSS